MSAADVIHLDDLAEPRFTPDVDEMRAAMTAMADAVSLEPDELVAAARAQAGLDDLGGDGWRPAFAVLTRALVDESQMSGVGVVSLDAQLTQCLVNRLRLAALIGAHPEILEVEVAAPIVIAGLPRTGTTHLHNLLAADPALRAMPYWESLEPVPPEDERLATPDPDPRLARTAVAIDFLHAALPHFDRMHEMTVEHIHEEIGLLAMTFSTMFFETLAPMPTYRDWYRSTDQRAAYREMKVYLQAMTWLRGGARWVLKTPQHLEQFGALMDVFPDATVIVTHRDPVSVTASMATMIAYTARMQYERPDLERIGAYWGTRLEHMLERCMLDRDLLPADRSTDVRFDDLMADMTGTVARIYELADQPLTGDSRRAHAAYLAGHGRDRHGKIDYRLEDVGLDVAERTKALRPYTERFGLRVEGAITR